MFTFFFLNVQVCVHFFKVTLHLGMGINYD